MESYWLRTLIVFEESFWVGYFEAAAESGEEYRVARHIFGPEPSEAEIREFVLRNGVLSLRWTTATEAELPKAAKSPKRLIREAARAVRNPAGATKAREAVKNERALRKTERRIRKKQRRDDECERQYALRQRKRKQKRRGH